MPKEPKQIKGIENLKPVRSEEEARALGKIGGIKSGEARKEKKIITETLEMLLNTEIQDDEVKCFLVRRLKMQEIQHFHLVK